MLKNPCALQADGEKDVKEGTTCESADSLYLSPVRDSWDSEELNDHWEKQHEKLRQYRRKKRLNKVKKKVRKPRPPKKTKNSELALYPDEIAEFIVAKEVQEEKDHYKKYDGITGNPVL